MHDRGQSIHRGVVMAMTLLMGGVAVEGQKRQWPYVYFFSGLGDYLKVEVATDQVPRGSLLKLEEIRSLLPERFRETSIGIGCCDRNTGWLYVLSPESAFISWDRTGHGTIRYRLVVLALPEFRLVGHTELAEPIDKGPNLLLTPDRKQLWVSYQVVSEEEAYWVFVREIFQTRGLKRVALRRERSRASRMIPKRWLKYGSAGRRGSLLMAARSSMESMRLSMDRSIGTGRYLGLRKCRRMSESIEAFLWGGWTRWAAVFPVGG